MKRNGSILLLLLFMACCASAKIGKYQICAGNYTQYKVTFYEADKPNAFSKIEPSESSRNGLFKIDTETGNVWEWVETGRTTITIDNKAKDQTVHYYWRLLEPTKEATGTILR